MIHVLVADDEALEREAMLHILAGVDTDEPIEVREAVNGLEALRGAQDKKPDIAFLDIRMPGMDGLGVAEKFSQLPDPPVVIMVTAYDYFAYARMALRFGVLDYLLKPASTEDICSVFRRALHEVAGRKKEAARRSAVQTIASGLEELVRADICKSLRAGTVNDDDIQRLVAFQAGGAAWSCIAMVAGTGRSSAYGVSPMAAHGFSRFFRALAERFLVSDLDLVKANPMLFIASPEQDADSATMNVFLVVCMGAFSIRGICRSRLAAESDNSIVAAMMQGERAFSSASAWRWTARPRQRFRRQKLRSIFRTPSVPYCS
jgi:Response regulator containing CheY-like receiver domain and AraC-type DNA-binding domain